MVTLRTRGPTIQGSGLLRSHGEKIREHGLDFLALALRTPRARLLVLGDVLTALEGHSAPLAVILVGRHRRFLQIRTCSWAGPHTRQARQADLDCTPGGGLAHRCVPAWPNGQCEGADDRRRGALRALRWDAIARGRVERGDTAFAREKLAQPDGDTTAWPRIRAARRRR